MIAIEFKRVVVLICFGFCLFFNNVIAATTDNPILKLAFPDIYQSPVYLYQTFSIPSDFKQIHVASPKALYEALEFANKTGKTAIILASGHYALDQTIQVINDDIWLLSETGNPYKTRLTGQGMRETAEVENLIWVSGNNFLLDGLLLEKAGNHLIQIAGEQEVQQPIIKNCVLQNGYEQLVKVSYDLGHPERYASFGVIEHCLFRYTLGTAPNYYTGGIDAHGIHHWRINDNVFYGIASPSEHVAEHAIHIWNNAIGTIIENNIIINSDRGIGLGLGRSRHSNIKYGHNQGVIRNNFIYHADNDHPFADVAIVIESSPNTVIENNWIYMAHPYRRAIEYRFEQTVGVTIQHNQANKPIMSLNLGQAELKNNKDLKLNQFIKALEGFMSTTK